MNPDWVLKHSPQVFATPFAHYEDLIHQGGMDRPRLEDVLRGHRLPDLAGAVVQADLRGLPPLAPLARAAAALAGDVARPARRAM